ncbi:DUF551 domain-containing protein [Klebsiella grimontii]|uniref:DUF551 domain-containing protein n=1 Tax=Klebsiella grimontii TaxID=2058152 RepID=UPI0021156495|nr:DUF551 domain-containing protein [Klebsiella grimontii]
MTSKFTREELLNIIETDHVQCGEASALARIALAAMDSEPVADVVAWSHPTEERTCDIRWRRHDVEPGPLYRHAQPAPVVTFYRDGIEAAANYLDQLREAYDSEHGRHDPETGSFEFGNDAHREYSSTLEELAEGIRGLHPNAGNSPVIPDGYVMVPKEPTEEMLAAAKEWTGLTSTAEAVYIKMLAAVPQLPGSEPAAVPGAWIPVSERMPEKQDGSVLLTWNGQYIGKELFLMGSFQCLKPEIITHWMPQPNPPKEVK